MLVFLSILRTNLSHVRTHFLVKLILGKKELKNQNRGNGITFK